MQGQYALCRKVPTQISCCTALLLNPLGDEQMAASEGRVFQPSGDHSATVRLLHPIESLVLPVLDLDPVL
jgi:hypothetical protein